MKENLGVEGGGKAVDAVGALDDGVEAEERGVDARLGEVELADLGGDAVGEDGGGVRGDDVEDGGGGLEGGEVVVGVGTESRSSD